MKIFAKKSLLSVGLVLAGGLLLTSPAHANFLLDGFGDDQGPVQSDTDSAPDSNGPMAITDTDFENAERTITAERTGGNGSGEVSLAIEEDQLRYSQDTQTSGTGTVDWTGFTPVAFSQGGRLMITVIESDKVDGGVILTLRSGANEESISTDLPAVTAGNDSEILLVALNGFSESLLSDVDSATLMINGQNLASLDASIEFVEVPAPGVLGLLGLGLTGIAFIVRRRPLGVATA